jgi:AraC-like DNA-binding protein
MLSVDTPLIPMTYVARWIALLGARGVPAECLLADADLTQALVDDAAARISADGLLKILHAGAVRANDPSLGFEFGLAMKPTSHGWLGYAMMSCSTLREACELSAQYMSVRASPWRMHVYEQRDTAVMQFEENLPLGVARNFVLECLLGATIRIGEFMLGHSFAHPEIEFCADYPEQPHHARFVDRVPRVRYSCDKIQARFPAAWLDRPLPLSEPVAKREAMAALENELQLISGSDDWVVRTRAFLAAPETHGLHLNLEDAAAKLQVSSRTLRRHLQHRGITFHALRDEARATYTIDLLAHSRISIDEIAHKAGFSSATGFARAFQRWTGRLPSSYRKPRGQS